MLCSTEASRSFPGVTELSANSSFSLSFKLDYPDCGIGHVPSVLVESDGYSDFHIYRPFFRKTRVQPGFQIRARQFKRLFSHVKIIVVIKYANYNLNSAVWVSRITIL